MPLDLKTNNSNKKIKDYTTRKPIIVNSASNSESPSRKSLKRPISPTQPSTFKKPKTMNTTKMDDETTITSPTLKVMEQPDKGGKIGEQ